MFLGQFLTVEGVCLTQALFLRFLTGCIMRPGNSIDMNKLCCGSILVIIAAFFPLSERLKHETEYSITYLKEKIEEEGE